jgi:FkbM family methyltransferase
MSRLIHGDEGRTDALWAASQLLRFVPSGLGAHAAARAVLARKIRTTRSLRRTTLAGGAHLELDVSDHTQAQAYLLRRYEPDVVALLRRIAPPGGTFFDVGANIGLITFGVGAQRRDLSIHAFEPDPENAERWRRNRRLNPGVAAKLEETAVGATAGEVALVRGGDSGWSFVAEPGAAGDVDVPVVSLDTYASAHGIPRIDVLKVDVEGYEAEVLRGATSLLERQAIGFIVCELDEILQNRAGGTRDELVAFLSYHGYTPKQIPGAGAQRLRPRSWQTGRDVLFVPGV